MDIERYRKGLIASLGELPMKQIKEAIEIVDFAARTRRLIFTMGNGGSAATASHIVNGLMKRSDHWVGNHMIAICLSDNIPTLTAWANDECYEDVFKNQLKNMVSPGDVVIAVSGSGNSQNIIRGLEVANESGAKTIALLGFDGGIAVGLAKIPIVVSCHMMEQVEDIHMAIGHMICTNL